MTKCVALMSKEEYLRALYHRLNDRCWYSDWYAGHGISNRFITPEHLIDYVLNTLQVEPRGKHCHRINNDWDYEPDNIEFLEPEDHAMVHRILRRERYDEAEIYNPFAKPRRYGWEYNYE